MTYRYLLTIIRDLLHCYLLELIHRMWIPKRGCQRHCHCIFLSSPNNQLSCILLPHSCCITDLTRAFFQYYCCFCCHFYCCFPNILTICSRIYHNFYILPRRTCHSCCYFYFLRRSTLEPLLLVQPFTVFLVFQFCLPEPTYIFLQIFELYLCDVDVTGYSDLIVLLR